MTNRPQLRLGRTLVPGALAIVLFALMALIVLNTSFGEMAGFDDVSITAAIGYALLDLGTLQESQGVPGTEPFLLAFLLVAVVLDAALDAALVLAKREEAGEPVAALSSGAAEGRPAGAAATDGGATTADGGATTADGISASDGDRGSRRGGERSEGPRSTSDRRSDGGEDA